MAIKFLNSVNADSGVLYVDADNNRVGIGTESPSTELHVKGGGELIRIQGDTGQSYITFFQGTGGRVGYIGTAGTAGIILESSDKLQIYAGSSERMRIDTAGNVGIGTTSPSAKLHVHHTSEEVLRIDSGNTGAIHFFENTTRRGILGYSNGTSIATAADAGDMVLRAESGSKLHLAIAGTSRLTVSGSNIGIGTTSPTSQLTLSDPTSPTLELNRQGSIANGWIKTTDSSSNVEAAIQMYGNEMRFYTAGESNQRMVINSSGNVGIGTTSPNALLEISRGDSGQTTAVAGGDNLILSDSSNGGMSIFTPSTALGSIFFGDESDSDVGWIRYNHTNDYMLIGTGGGTRVTIKNNGLINLGAYGAGYLKSDASGNITVDSDTIEDTLDSVTTRGNTTTNNITVANVISTGNIGIGTSSPTAKLDVRTTSGYAVMIANGDVGSGTNNRVQLRLSYNGTDDYSHFITTRHNSSSSSDNAIDFYTSDSTQNGVYPTNAIHGLTIEAGNVGIGTTSPADKLHVSVSSGNYQIDGDSSGNIYHKSQSGEHRFRADGGTTNAFTIANNLISTLKTAYFSSNVGIGTTSPSHKLHIESGVLKIQGTSSVDGTAIFVAAAAKGTQQSHIHYGSDGDWYIRSASTSGKIVIQDNGGNVGIGTSSPSEKLHVSGDVRIEGDLTVNGSYTQIDTDVNTTEQWNVTNDGTGPAVTINQTGSQDIMDVQDDGTSVFYIEDGGNVGIGTTDPAANVDVKSDANPTIRITSGKDGTWTADEEIGSVEFYSSDGSGVGAGVRSAIRSLAYDNYGSRSELTFSTTGSTGDTENMRITSYGKLKLNQYGSNTFTGTAAYALAVDSSGNVIETSYIPSSSSTDFVAVAGDTMTGKLTISSSEDHLLIDNTASDGSARIRFKARSDRDAGPYIKSTARGSTSADSDIRIGDENGDIATFNAGRVGIGTSSPANILDIDDGAVSDVRLRGNQTTDARLGAYNFYNTAASDTVAAISADRDGANDAGALAFDTQVAGGGMTERMRITSTGNVGIGTTSPTRDLHIVKSNDGGQVRFQIINTSNTADSTSVISIYNGGADGGDPFLHWKIDAQQDWSMGIDNSDGDKLKISKNFGPGTNDYLTVDTSGNVGIGTTSPLQKLDVSGVAYFRGGTAADFGSGNTPTDTALVIDEGDFIYTKDNTYLRRLIGKTTGDIIQIGESGTSLIDGIELKPGSGGSGRYIAFFDNNTESARFTGGNLGIGTTSPSEKLHVVGDVILGEHRIIDLPSFNMGGSSVTDEYLVVCKQAPSGGGVNASGIQGRISFSRGSSGSFNNSQYIDINIQMSLDNGNVNNLDVTQFELYKDNTLSIFSQLEEIDIDGTKYVALKARSSGGGSVNHFYFEGSISDASDTNILSRVRASDSTVTVTNPQPTGFPITPYITKNQDGDIGIGTTDPSANLEVAGAVKVTDSALGVTIGGVGHASLRLNRASTSYDNNILFNTNGDTKFRIWQDGNADYLYIRDDDNATNMVTFKKGGKVGIGTTSPESNLHVYTASGQANIKVQSGGNDAVFFANALTNFGIWGFDNARLSLATDSTERVSITGDGNVGIGTTSPVAKLDVNGDAIIRGRIYFDGTTSSYIDNVGSDLTLRSDNNFKVDTYSGGWQTRLTIVDAGSVGIGTTSPSEKLEVNGNVKADNLIGGNDAGIYTFNDTVDASSSEDIFSISNAHGAQAFRVTFVCSTSSYSVAKTYEVVHAYGTAPIFFKVVDTGAYGTHDFEVSFTNDATDDSKVVCSITNNSTTINADIVTTVFLGGSPTAITVTAL